MEKLSDMYYLFRFIISRIFIYLRDIILHEFFWFAEEIDDVDPTVTKTRAQPFTRRAIADFVAFFTICAFFGSFVVLSAECKNKKEQSYNPPLRPATPDSDGEPLELLEEDDCTILSSPQENATRHPWGDAATPDSDLESFTRQKLSSRNHSRVQYSPEIRQSSSSIFELRSSHSQHSQSTQTNEKILQRASKNRAWLIRKTRSGHIYGKYPM